VKRAIAALLVMGCCFSAAAQSAPMTIDLVLDDGRTVSAKQLSDYTFEYRAEIGETIDAVRLYGAKPGTVIHQNVEQAAVGEDGPWANIPGIRAVSKWKYMGGAEKQGAYVLTGAHMHAVQAAPIEANPDALRHALKDDDRWGPIAARCTSATSSPCYSYRAEDRFHFQAHGEQAYRFIIYYPGGC
jgi:hypothetical protein